MLETRSTPTVAATATRRSPFAGHTPFERPTRTGHIAVRLQADTVPSVTLVSCWTGAADALCGALAAALGDAVPGKTGETVRTDAYLLLRTGPEECMFISDRALDITAQLRQHIAADIGSVTDLSHARCRIRMAGEKSREVLSKLFPLDLRLAAFPLEQIRLSGHHHVPCMLHRLDTERFDVYVMSTYAFDQLATIIDAALEYGVALQEEWTSGTA